MTSDIFESVYVPRNVSPENAQKIQELTTPKDWDYERFNRVIVTLANNREYIPASNRPDTIDIGRIDEKLDYLSEKSNELGEETAQVIFADTDNGKLIFGKITKGMHDSKGYSVRLDMTRQEGREMFQKVSLTAHTHPDNPKFADQNVGFKDEDYIDFLRFDDEIGQFMRVGGITFLCLKTNVTPNNMDPERIEAQVKKIWQETVATSQKSKLEKLVDFNRQVCTEFGMVLYMSGKDSGSKLERVSVAGEPS